MEPDEPPPSDDKDVEFLMVVTPAKKRKPPPKPGPETDPRKPSVVEKKRASKAAKREENPGSTNTVVDIWVPGRPKPKRRPNKSRIGAIYNASHKEEKEFNASFTHQVEAKYGKLTTMFEKNIPLRVELSFFYPHQKFTLHTTADVDNLAKLVLDSIEGTVFVNDNQVVELTARKLRSYDETEGTHVVITPALIDHLRGSPVAK